MPLMTTKPMFDLAYTGGFAVGAFNVNNMELAQSIIDACAKESSPLILQISKGARKYANIRYLKHIIDAAVEEHPELPIAIHCDHGDTIDLIQTCVNDGYTSVMIDASHHPLEENIHTSAAAVKVAHAAGVVVEAELGMLGGIEEDVVGMDAHEYEKNVEKFLTDPVQAADFAKRTQIDSLAVAIGTSHGVFKVNIDTDLRLAMTAKIREVFATKPAEFDPRNYLGPAREAITKMVQRKLHMLNSDGKADAIIKHWEKAGKPMPAFYKKGAAA